MDLVNLNKSELVSNFYQRLIDTYGYVAGQIELDFLLGGIVVDIAIWANEDLKNKNTCPEVCVAVECRVEHIRIDASEYFKKYRAGFFSTRHFFVANNLKETRVFYQDSSRFDGLVSIGDFPKAMDLVSVSALDKFINKMHNNSKETLLTAFSRCHNIIRNNDKLSPEAAFDEISKVIFVKMKYERSNPQEELIYSERKFLQDERTFGKGDYMNELFKDVIKDYKTNSLFDEQERIRMKRQSFLQILKELEIVDFCYMQEDIKGVAFEAFLGKTFRGELGQFFTPRTIVNFMVDVLDIKEGETVCDPCCGSGGFLICAFEYIQNQIEHDVDTQLKNVMSDSSLSDIEKKNKVQVLISELDKTQTGTRMWKLCHSYLYGVDANPRMARTSKMNMIMHGDGHIGVYQHDGLTNVGDIQNGMFDVVLINPPYGIHIDRKQEEEITDKSIGDLYELKTNNAEALFIERTLKLLKPGGRAGLVLPEGVMTNTTISAVTLREYVEAHAKILNITSIPADVFLSSGANVKPSLLFIQKLRENESNNKEISVSMVSDAGINSLGIPSNNSQLIELTPILKKWIKEGVMESSGLAKVVKRTDMEAWKVATLFITPKVHFNPRYPVCQLSDILIPAGEPVNIQDNEMYSRVTVKLFNKGLSERDCVKGSIIGTKKQKRVHTGDFVVSKIDGKSGAFGYVPAELEGAIVTQDFLVFRVDTNKVLPEYLELILASDDILNQYKVESSGSTGRKRLQPQVLLRTIIPLPDIKEQREKISTIVQMRKMRDKLERQLKEQEMRFRTSIFC